MRKILLASAAMLSATAGMAIAQERQQFVEPAYAGVKPNTPVSGAGANNNNNVQAAMIPGPTANPQPGTFVIRLGGRVNVEAGAGWSSLDSIGGTGPANTGAAKRNPYGMGTYFRLYPGLDAMATNGLRYGAAAELRTNWGGNVSGGSAETSGQTMYVRRAFVYAAGDNWGLVRVGQGDGTISLFDGGVTTGQNWSNSGVLNGGDAQVLTPSRTAIPFYWMAVAGNEYGTNKVIYVSPKVFGVEGSVLLHAEHGQHLQRRRHLALHSYGELPDCSSNCSTLSSSSAASDASRYTDLYQVGLRYLNDIGPVNVRVFGVYVGSGQVNYTGLTPRGTVTGLYDNLGVLNAGAAVTYAGFTLAANWIGGAMNGQFTLKPAGGANLNATTASLQYVTGPLTLGITGAVDTAQGAGQIGAASLVGQTQLDERQISAGGRWVVAPGLAISADYIYQQRRQNGYNWQTATINAPGAGFNTNSQIQAQTVLLGVAVNW